MIKNIALLSAGSGIAQLIVITATPFLSRLYTPEEFGVLAVILAVSAIIIPFATLRYESALLIRSDEYPPASLFMLSLAILCVVTLILWFLKSHIYGLVFNSDGVPGLKKGIIIIYVFLLGLNSILTSWSSRLKRFNMISIALIAQSLCAVSIQLYLGLESIQDGLIYGHLMGLIAYAATISFAIISYDYKDILNQNVFRMIGLAAIRQKNFPIYSTWSSLLNGMANNLPNILFSKFFSTVDAGHYAMATRIIRNPLSIIGQSIYQVIAQHSGEHHDQYPELSQTLVSVLKKMAYIAIIPFLVMSIFLENIITYLLGHQWESTATYARILLPWLFLTYMTWPLTGTYNAIGRQRKLLAFNAIFVIGIFLSFSALLINESILTVLVLLSIFGTASRFYYLYWLLSELDKDRCKSPSVIILAYTATIGLSSFIGHVVGW